MAQFHVTDAFAINDQAVYVLSGFVVEGEITAGMLLRVPFHATAMMTAKIDQIQQLRRPDGNVTCLCLRCTKPQEIALWTALALKDKMLEVIKA